MALLLIIILSLFFVLIIYCRHEEHKKVKLLKQKLKDEQEIYMKLVKIRRRHRAKLRRKTKIMHRNNINF